MSLNRVRALKFDHTDTGTGVPMILLHGLMGDLSNFQGMLDYFPQQGYRVIVPQLPLYSSPILKTNVSYFAKHLKKFIDHLALKKVILVGNSLGGHIALLFSKRYSEHVEALVITGSSGLYESAMGESYPKRGDYEYIKQKARDVFYDPAVATDEVVDGVYAIVNDRNKLLKTLAIAKSAIRHNMARDLPKMKMPSCIIWGAQDQVTPPEVAMDFKKFLPDSELFWIDKCGHAAMMEHPDEFNRVLYNWLRSRGL